MTYHELETALEEGRVDALPALLIGLDAEDRALLEAEMGAQAFARTYAAAARRARGPKRGRVILLHGIMGADLDVERAGDRDRVWIHYLRLFDGRIQDLRLKPDGSPADPAAKVIVRGQNKKYYLPPLLELANHWDVRPFAYDWRLDIRSSADRLAELVRSFGQGEPLHLVAHSMGGLVSRAFIQRHGELWARCDDASGRRRGGRLVMLGTPNHGSYVIPLVLTGQESIVRKLALLDRKHKLPQLLAILATFQGSYQMLPSRLESSADDRAKLYDPATWRGLAVKEHLEDAHRLHETLRPIVDAERFVYVAGTDQETPAAVVVRADGMRFAYTRAGDGRVPHALGLLPGVRTYYVTQNHGDLPIDERVLASIHELLESGATSELDPAPAVRRRGLGAFVAPVEPIPPEFLALIAKDAGRRRGGPSRLTKVEQRRVESLLLEVEPESVRAVAGSPPKAKQAARSRRTGTKKAKKPATLTIDVVWGDTTKVAADVYAVGHYQGVLPQYAERALDEALSGTADPDQQVLRQHTLRGQLRGALGDVDLFPWIGGARSRTVAVAGMGAPGTFTPQALSFLVRKLVWTVSNLPAARTIATVLIGSGEGTLPIRESIRSYLVGIREALEHGEIAGRDFRLRIVELYRDRAEEIRDELREAERETLARVPPGPRIRPRISKAAGGRLRERHALDIVTRLVAEDAPRGAARRHFRGLLDSVQSRAPELSEALGAVLRGLVEKAGEEQGHGGRRDGRDGRGGNPRRAPIRMSFSRDASGVRVAAISSTTTVSERILRFDPSLLDELVEKTESAEEASVERFSSFVTRLLLPAEFRQWIATEAGPFVFEVDREMARVHWEMLETESLGNGGVPLAQVAEVARQLRTTYSPAPAPPPRKSDRLRILVVGDPGDPGQGDDLPGAQEEALAVVEFLREQPDVTVEARIGAPGRKRTGVLREHPAAGRLEVLKDLLTGDYDVLHYCGHGDFDPEDGERAGWVFSEGLLTSREIERVESPPPLVVANACLSARTSRAKSSRGAESRLLPSLADEFFRRGVRAYVGTAWTVNDLGAVLFAKAFYASLLAEGGGCLGEAVLAARRALYEEKDFGGLWSAYQLYGDPGFRVRRPADSA